METLRVWERRYQVAAPRLSEGGQRLYAPADIRRLTLVKQLVDGGHGIGTVAGLSTDALMALVSHGLVQERGSGGLLRRTRVVGIGRPLWAGPLEQALAAVGLQLTGSSADVVTAPAALNGVQADLVLIDLPTLQAGAPATVQHLVGACGADQALVLYRFAPGAVIRQLRADGHAVARSNADLDEIAGHCRRLLEAMRPFAGTGGARRAEGDVNGTSARGAREPPPPRFDALALARLATASGNVYCECPRHLVELVSSIGSFERYSAECATRGSDDAALHRALQRSAGHARALLEGALLQVALAEGLPVPPDAHAIPGSAP